MAETTANKLVEQATSKADLSYSYWAAGQPTKTGTFTEKKLTEVELKEAEKRAREALDKGVSVWNQAGTFEERDVSGWANQQLQALLVGLEHRTESAVITLTELKSTKGEAHVWIMRGKKRAGFDFTIEAKWSAAMVDSSAAAASGTLDLANVSPDELDELGDLMKITVTDKAEGISSDAELKRAVKSIAEKLEQQFTKLHQLLKEK